MGISMESLRNFVKHPLFVGKLKTTRVQKAGGRGKRGWKKLWFHLGYRAKKLLPLMAKFARVDESKKATSSLKSHIFK